MSNDEVWHFVRGQESLGPFTKDMLQKVYEAGQIQPETLVWREGMPNWLPAKSIPELEIPRKEASATSAEINSSPSEAHHPVGGKLKLKENVAPPPARSKPVEMPAPISAPLPKAPAPEESKPIAPNPEPTSDEKPHVKGPSLITRALRKVFSSSVMTPLFLIAAGAIIYSYQAHLPNVYWFAYLAYAFAAYGVLSLAGVHGLDSLFHVLAILFLAPAIALFWPVIMADTSWKTVPAAHWTFLGISFLYCTTTRIGMRLYTSTFASRFASATGLASLALLFLLGTKQLEPAGWKDLVAQTITPKLPAGFAKAIGRPEWGSGAGWLKITAPSASEHRIESASVKRYSESDLRLTLKTMDDLFFIVKMNVKGDELKPEAIVKQAWPVYFSKEAANDTEVMVPTWNLEGGGKAEISAANLTVTEIKNQTWSGMISFTLQGDQPPVVGTFSTDVTVFSPDIK